MPYKVEQIQQDHKQMSPEAWAASFDHKTAIKSVMAPPVKAVVKEVAVAALAPAPVATSNETGTARLYGMTPQEWADGMKSTTPEAIECNAMIEQMKNDIDSMDAKIHVITPLPETQATEKTARKGFSLFSALGNVALAILRVMFCCCLCSSSSKSKATIKAAKYPPEAQQYLARFRDLLNDSKAFMETIKAQLPNLSDVDAMKKVQCNFKAYAMEKLNYTVG